MEQKKQNPIHSARAALKETSQKKRINCLANIIERTMAADDRNVDLIAIFCNSLVRGKDGSFSPESWTPQDIRDLEAAINQAYDFTQYCAYMRKNGCDPEDVPPSPYVLKIQQQEVFTDGNHQAN